MKLRHTFYGLAATLMIGLTQTAQASDVNWVDWTSTTQGTLGDINVSMTGPSWNLVNGDQYYKDYAETYNFMNPTDLIRHKTGGTYTISFDGEVNDLYMSVVSLGRPNNNFVTYDFNNPISVISSGRQQWTAQHGYALNDNNLEGHEYSGILHISGDFGPDNALTFEVQGNEHWGGFNLGTAVSAVPEPSTYALMLSGLGLVGFMAARKRRNIA